MEEGWERNGSQHTCPSRAQAEVVQTTCCRAQVVWASRQQPAHLRVLSTARLLNRSHFPQVSLCWGGALWETHITRAHAVASSAGGRKPLSTGTVTAPSCVFLLAKLKTSDYYCPAVLESGYPAQILPVLSAILCASLIFLHSSQYPLFLCNSSVQAYYLHGWDSASMQKALWTLILKGHKERMPDSHSNMKLSLMSMAAHYGLRCFMQIIDLCFIWYMSCAVAVGKGREFNVSGV